jgi:hypothetical protein
VNLAGTWVRWVTWTLAVVAALGALVCLYEAVQIAMGP